MKKNKPKCLVYISNPSLVFIISFPFVEQTTLRFLRISMQINWWYAQKKHNNLLRIIWLASTSRSLFSLLDHDFFKRKHQLLSNPETIFFFHCKKPRFQKNIKNENLNKIHIQIFLFFSEGFGCELFPFFFF